MGGMRTWLIVDTPSLAYRAWHTTKGLSFNGVETGVAYGVLKEVKRLQEQFGTPYVVFCFESRFSLRRKLYPDYKRNRRPVKHVLEAVVEGAEDRARVQSGLRRLKADYLPEIGFRNLFSQTGYEADDMIAVVAEQLAMEKERVVIVSPDNDMLQLLNERVSIWSPIKKQLLTADEFETKRGLRPCSWAEVKAMAGCSSDCVPGIRGVGETTATKYLNGTLNPKSKTAEKIRAAEDIVVRNLPLVKLPFEGARIGMLNYELPTVDGWRRVLKRLGIKTIGA